LESKNDSLILSELLILFEIWDDDECDWTQVDSARLETILFSSITSSCFSWELLILSKRLAVTNSWLFNKLWDFKKETKSINAVLLWLLIFLIFSNFSYKREAEYLIFGF
jgi:hypothetical protein